MGSSTCSNHNEAFHTSYLFDGVDDLDMIVEDKTDLEQVKKFAWATCREYLGGDSKHLKFSLFTVERFLGGRSNYAYLCKINDENWKGPKQVMLKLYGDNKSLSTWIHYAVITTLLSSNQLGPWVYGLFQQGQLEEFIEYPRMNHSEFSSLENYLSLARAVARFHSLDVPIRKEPCWLHDAIHEYMDQLQNMKFTQKKDIERYEQFMRFDLVKELDKLMPILKSINSPVVFSHNDINPSNTLATPHRVTLIDYEFCSYNYRGFDLGSVIGKCMLNTSLDTYPGFVYDYNIRPSNEQQMKFMETYINEFKQAISEKFERLNKSILEAKKYLESMNLDVECLLKESAYFELAYHIFNAFWAICSSSKSDVIEFDYLDNALARSDAYFRQKKILFPYGFKL